MFQFKGLLQAIGVTLLITIGFSVIIGFFPILSIEGNIIANYIISYVGIGVLAPLWNRKTPYFAAFIGSISIMLINFAFSMLVYRIPILLNPLEVNSSMALCVITSFITALIFVSILNRKERASHV